MKDSQTAMSKKFLFNEQKKSKDVEEERQFHSKGYHPLEKQSLINLDSVWSVKDVVLTGGTKPVLTDKINASTGYYSRHSQSKVSKEKPFLSSGNPAESSQWNRKTELNNPQQRHYQSQEDPLDF